MFDLTKQGSEFYSFSENGNLVGDHSKCPCPYNSAYNGSPVNWKGKLFVLTNYWGDEEVYSYRGEQWTL